MGHHNKKVYDSLPFKNQAIDTITITGFNTNKQHKVCLWYTSTSARDRQKSRMPSSA